MQKWELKDGVIVQNIREILVILSYFSLFVCEWSSLTSGMSSQGILYYFLHSDGWWVLICFLA